MTLRNSLLMVFVALAGCQETIEAPDLPYVERMVVYSVVVAGDREVTVSFTRTLPVNDRYTLAKAALLDVTGSIETEGTVYPLHYDSLGVYRTSGLMVKPGGVYALHAVWHGKSCDAQTVVPIPVHIDTAVIVAGIAPFYWPVVRAVFLPKPGEAYGMTWQIRSPVDSMAPEYGFSSLVRQEDARSDGTVAIDEQLYVFPGVWESIARGDSLWASVQAFDGPYYDYFKSYPRGSSSDDIFAQPGGNVKWNVKGDAIGLFIGKSVSSRIVVF